MNSAFFCNGALEIYFTANGIRKHKHPPVLAHPNMLNAECIHNYTLISLLLRVCCFSHSHFEFVSLSLSFFFFVIIVVIEYMYVVWWHSKRVCLWQKLFTIFIVTGIVFVAASLDMRCLLSISWHSVSVVLLLFAHRSRPKPTANASFKVAAAIDYAFHFIIHILFAFNFRHFPEQLTNFTLYFSLCIAFINILLVFASRTIVSASTICHFVHYIRSRW